MSAARSRTLRRRRDVFTALLGAAAVSLVLGLVPAFRVMLLVHLAVDVLLVAYVALLIRQRSLAAEREMKVRFLPESRPMQPALLRRSVN
jgi:type III secretory pathway component EscV